MSSLTEPPETVEENVRNLGRTIQRTAEDAGRDPESLKLIAVTKGFNRDVVELAASLGLRAIGENRVREAVEKKESLSEPAVKDLEWHMIGHVQSNKVKHLLGHFELIHSLDRESLLDELDKRLSRNGLRQSVLMQVNVSGEESKHGISPEEAPGLLERILEAEPLDCRGLMTMAPLTDERELIRRTFANCRSLRDSLEDEFEVELPELSMGMTNDYQEAIREGSTMVRIGRGLFGERPG